MESLRLPFPTELWNAIAHRRLESLGRVMAAAVHDMRAPLSSIVFGIDVLAQRSGELSEERTREIVSDVRTDSIEAGQRPTTVHVSTRVEGQTVHVLVEDDCPAPVHA